MTTFFQKKITFSPRRRGFHLVTDEILDQIPEVKAFRVGFLQVFLCHTSASLTINENADPDVRTDMETAANRLCPESSPFIHTCEGPDDMPAHVKCSLFGPQVMIPISNGSLALGIWQGIYLCEHRDRASARTAILTVMGERLPESAPTS